MSMDLVNWVWDHTPTYWAYAIPVLSALWLLPRWTINSLEGRSWFRVVAYLVVANPLPMAVESNVAIVPAWSLLVVSVMYVVIASLIAGAAVYFASKWVEAQMGSAR